MFLEKLFSKKIESAIKFPKFDDLSFEQKEAVNLPIDKHNVILGAPGTGKTVVAIYRLHKIYESTKKKSLFLVYNRALYNYIEEVKKALGIEDEFYVSTVNDFVYYDLYNGEKPGKEKNLIDKHVPHIGDNKYNTDWKQVFDDVKQLGKLYDYVVVDEGQDFNNYFYETIHHIARHLTIFADPNQAIQNDGAKISDILKLLNKEAYYILTLNYRNSRNIVDWTRRYCNDKSIFAESYVDKDDLEIINYRDDGYIDIIKNIIRKYDNNTNIGIIVPNVKNAEGKTDRTYEYGIYDSLKNDFGNKYIVSLYYNEKVLTDEETHKRENVDFSKNSIKIFNYATMRGLDFDIVILLDNFRDIEENEIIDTFGFETTSSQKEINKKIISKMNKLYVASTRAKNKLYILKDSSDDNFSNSENEISYNHFDNITNISLTDCIKCAKDADASGDIEKALYYYHYALAVLGIDAKWMLRQVLCSFANICVNCNKADFALGAIFNYSYKYSEIDDENLVFFYLSALIRSYNSDFVYNNVDKFLKRVSLLQNSEDINYLLCEFFNEYVNRCYKSGIEIDKDFAKDVINKYNLGETGAYKEFIERCKNNESDDEINESDDNKIKDEIDEKLKEIIDGKTAHELLADSYITVVSGTQNKKVDYVHKAVSKGFKEDDFDFHLSYDELTNTSFDYIKKDSDKPAAIIYGTVPHSTKGKGDFSSMLMKWKQPGYPKVFEPKKHNKDLSISMFKNLLDDIIIYLKDRMYRKKKVDSIDK